MLSTKKLAVRT